MNSIRKILYLGPQGSYCEYAMREFNLNIEAQSVNSIKKIIDEIDKNPDFMAVLPIENFIEGIVVSTLDNLVRTKDKNLRIIAQNTIKINHCLLSREKDIKNIKTIISHPQALAQCQGFIADNFPFDIEIIEAQSTSTAAKIASETKEAASISNLSAAKLYNLNVLKDEINDEKGNVTRFVLIGREKAKKGNKNRTSIFFSVKNEAGSLMKALSAFVKNGLNMIYLQSRPSRTKFGEYTFFADVEGFINDEKVQNALKELECCTTSYRIIGSWENL